MASLRYWLVELPARITEAGFVWYRAYVLFLCLIAALTLPVMVLTMLVLWFGFGIRWGW